MERVFLSLAAMSGLSAVIIGAFGAHGLDGKITSDMMSIYTTGVQYQFYHTLALLAVALYIRLAGASRLLLLSGLCFCLGIVAFSGSLYWLALAGPRWLGPVTPLGGLCFIAGWAALFISSLGRKQGAASA